MKLYEIDQAIESLIDPETGEITNIELLKSLSAEREVAAIEAAKVISENELQLVINDKTLGSLTTNALQIKEAITAALPNYDIGTTTRAILTLPKRQSDA